MLETCEENEIAFYFLSFSLSFSIFVHLQRLLLLARSCIVFKRIVFFLLCFFVCFTLLRGNEVFGTTVSERCLRRWRRRRFSSGIGRLLADLWCLTTHRRWPNDQTNKRWPRVEAEVGNSDVGDGFSWSRTWVSRELCKNRNYSWSLNYRCCPLWKKIDRRAAEMAVIIFATEIAR